LLFQCCLFEEELGRRKALLVILKKSTSEKEESVSNDWTLRLFVLGAEKWAVNFIAIGYCHVVSRKDFSCEPQAIYFPKLLLLLALPRSFNGCPDVLIVSTGYSLLTTAPPSVSHKHL
jgi:hypothetical protein